MTQSELDALLSAVNLYSSFFLLLIVICFVAFISILAMLIHNIKNRRNLKENKEFISEIIQTQEKERKIISQELHDTVSQNIKTVLLKEKELLEEMEKQSPGTSGTEQLQKIILLEKQNQKELRSIMQNLNLSFQKGIAFKNAINDLCLKFKEESKCPCVFFVSQDVDLEIFTQEERHHILRIIQEALNNIKLHAAASEASVIIQPGEKKGQIRIMIFDDGVSFDKSRAVPDDNTHFGMTGMEMRAKLLGGSLTVESKSETGTEVRLDLDRKEF